MGFEVCLNHGPGVINGTVTRDERSTYAYMSI